MRVKLINLQGWSNLKNKVTEFIPYNIKKKRTLTKKDIFKELKIKRKLFHPKTNIRFFFMLTYEIQRNNKVL